MGTGKVGWPQATVGAAVSPADPPHELRCSHRAVLTRNLHWSEAYLVDARAALQLLESAHPEAASWWRSRNAENSLDRPLASALPITDTLPLPCIKGS